MTALTLPPLNKPYRIVFESRPLYLHVTIRCGTTSYPIEKRYWTEILSMQRRLGYDRVLIDRDIADPPPMHDVVLLASELAHSGTRNVKFAIYDRNYDAKRCGFEEMAGTNRGLEVKICGNLSEAENWLSAQFVR